MTGARTRRLLREDMDRRYYRLSQFLGYLGGHWPDFYETPEQAIDKAIAEYPVELRQEVRRELASVLAETPDAVRLRDVLNHGLGVNVYFKEAAEARAFAEFVEGKVLASIKQHFDESRARGAGS